VPAVDFPRVSRETLAVIPRQNTTLGKNYSVPARELDTNYPDFPLAKKNHHQFDQGLSAVNQENEAPSIGCGMICDILAAQSFANPFFHNT
jgi:hypothetical protein